MVSLFFGSFSPFFNLKHHIYRFEDRRDPKFYYEKHIEPHTGNYTPGYQGDGLGEGCTGREDKAKPTSFET